MNDLFWNNLNELIQDNPIFSFAVEIIKTYGIEKVLQLYQKKQRRTVNEELLLCLEYSLETFSKDYQLEYSSSMGHDLLKELREKPVLSQSDWKFILEKVTGLKFDDHIVDEWCDILIKTISEKRLVVLRDYIQVGHCCDINKKEAYPRILTAKPSLPPEQYIERLEFDEIMQKVQDARKLVLVNGLGGIGKSTVCRKVFHKFDEEENRTLAWITYHDEDLLEDLRRQLFFPKEVKNWEKRFLQFLQQDIEDTAVIFIDNVNAAEEEEPFLQELANAKCSVICTSRITEFSHFETVPIDFFSIDDCVRLFYGYYGLEFDAEKIRRIVAKTGRHTLVIEILAKIAKAERYTLDELENQLQISGFDLGGIASVDLREDTLIGHLSHTFNIAKLNVQQRRILYCMAILPVERISHQFKDWLELPNRYNLNYLEKHAWFVADEQGFYMHPVIKEVVKRVIDPQPDAAALLLKNLTEEISYKDNPDHERSMQIISYIEALLPYLKESEPEILAQAFYNISMLYGQFQYNKLALMYVKKCIDIIELQCGSARSDELLGCAYNHQGYVFYYEFEDERAKDSYLNAYRIRKRMKNKKLLAQTQSNLALLYQGMWSEEKDPKTKTKYLLAAKKYQKGALDLFINIFHGAAHSNLASAYNNMAVIMDSLGEYQVAVFYYKKAAEIRNCLKDVSLGDLSVTCFGLSNTFFNMAANSEKRIYCLHYLKMSSYYLDKARKIRVSEIRKGNQKWGLDKLNEQEQRIHNMLLYLSGTEQK